MITVRFLSGFSVQYNDANYSFREVSQTLIYESSLKKKLFAIVPNDALIEHQVPCKTYQAAGESPTVELQLNALKREIASLKRTINKEKRKT